MTLWLDAYLIDAVERRLCTKIGCTTCGAREFRDGVRSRARAHVKAHAPTSFSRRDQIWCTVDALAALAPREPSHAHVDAVRCVLYDL